MVALPGKTVALGSPQSPTHKIDPIQLADWMSEYESLAASSGINYIDGTLSNLNARSGVTDGEYGLVINDQAEAGVYERVSGSWTKKAGIPAVFTESLAAADAEAAQAAAEVAQAAAEVAETNAAASASAASSSATGASDSAASANASQEAAELAAEASGNVLFYDTKADANSALSGLSENQIVEVIDDESRSGVRSRYRVESGALVHKLDFFETHDLVHVNTNGAIGNGQQFLFMDIASWQAFNGGASPTFANNFHFFTEGLARVEFEANGTGSDMEFYIEGGTGQEVWYGLQEENSHEWSFGMDTASDTDLKFVPGMGIAGGFQVMRLRGGSNNDVVVQNKLNVGELNPTQTTSVLTVFGNQVVANVRIENDNAIGGGILIDCGDGSSSGFFLKGRTSGGTEKIVIQNSGVISTEGFVRTQDDFRAPAGSAAAPTFINKDDNTTGVFFPATSKWGVATAGSEVMRADAGNLLIGKTSTLISDAGVQFVKPGQLGANAITSDGEEALFMNRLTSTGAIVTFRQANATVGSISVTASATAYNTTSDYRLKENVVDLDGAIDRLKQVKTHRFNFITTPDQTVDGFIAHEVQEIVPEAVTGQKDEVENIGDVTNADGNVIEQGIAEPAKLPDGHTWTETGTAPVYQGIDQSKLVPLLTAALQEAVAKIEALEVRIANLEGAA